MDGPAGEGRLNQFDMEERLAWSDGVAISADVNKILLDRIPAALRVERADGTADRNGTDWWVVRKYCLNSLSIDLKARDFDWLKKGQDDLALETWSVLPTDASPGKVGWTRDPEKRTDYILWLWCDTLRFCLVPFPALCKAFTYFWEDWSKQYKTRRQNSGGWQSECVFVPRQVVFAAINRWSNSYLPKRSETSIVKSFGNTQTTLFEVYEME